MPAPHPSNGFSPIGEFSQLSGLTQKALRIYHDNGLLVPAHVDPTNGYRHYQRDQVKTARLIAMLRSIGFALDDIALFLIEASTDRDGAATRLNDHIERLEIEHSARRLLTQHIHTVLRHKESTMFPIQTRHVPAMRVMSIQRRLLAPETDAFIAEAKQRFGAHLGGAEPTGPFTVLFHGIVDHDSDGPIEAVLGCPDDTQPTDDIGVRTEPEHDEAFTTITKAQWDFPAILAAYDAVASSPEATARPGSRLSCREVYLAEPDSIGNDELICDVAFPLGPV